MKLNCSYLLLNCTSDISEVVWGKIQKRLHFQSGHLLQNKPVICGEKKGL